MKPLLLVVLLGLPATLPAQIDYRNLDDERPTFSEDAYPVERFAFELLASWRFESRSDGSRIHLLVPELAWGAFSNGQIGFKLPLAGTYLPGESSWGLAGLRAFALYNFTTEGEAHPGLSLRADAAFPVGHLGGEATRVGLKAIATRSFGAQRVHLNLAGSAGGEGIGPAGEPLARWSAGAAVDRTLVRQSLLLLGELYAIDHEGAEVEIIVGAGGRMQLTPTLVLDAGVARRLSREGPQLAVTLGVSHAFAIAGLMPSPSSSSR